jgi:hypothetical protein
MMQIISMEVGAGVLEQLVELEMAIWEPQAVLLEGVEPIPSQLVETP